MNAKEIYLKTMKFVWAKAILGIVVLVGSMILLGISTVISKLASGGSITGLALLIWLICTPGLHSFVMHYFGYLIKAGHVAVIAEACSTGQIPENMIEYGKEKVKKRFVASNVYFLVDKLVGSAVSQLQKGVDAVGNLLSFIPGSGFLTSFAKTFIGISLNYVDECCLGWCFLHDDENAFQASCDGVVIYFQNMKALLKPAAITSLVVVGVTLASWLVPLIILGGLFSLFHWSMMIAIILSILIAWVVKFAFVDSWMMVKMMCSYMETADATQISYDLYEKLGKLSSGFRKLSEKAKEETVNPQAEA